MSLDNSFFSDKAPPSSPPPQASSAPSSAGDDHVRGGAPIHDPKELSRKNNRRKSLILGCVAALGIIAMIVLFFRDDDANPEAAARRANNVARADTGAVTVGNRGNTGIGIDTVGMDAIQRASDDPNAGRNLGLPTDLADQLGSAPPPSAPSSSGNDMLGLGPAPTINPDLPPDPGQGFQPQAPPAPAPANSTPKPQLDLTGGSVGGGGLLGALTRVTRGAGTEPIPTTESDPLDEAEREATRRAETARLDSIRAADEEARLARLRAHKVNLLSGNAPSTGIGEGSLLGLDDRTPRGTPETKRVFIPMDAYAPAVLVTEYQSGLEGDWVIAQMTAPLRVQGTTLLPAGTRAQGTVTARPGRRGVPTQVTIRFNRFILPNGQVAEGFNAVAGDPQTLGMGITGVGVNRHYPEQIVGAGLASAFELLVGSLSKNRPSAWEQQSVWDQSVANVRDRGVSIFAGEFAEGRWEPTIRLKKNTPIALLFGVRESEVEVSARATGSAEAFQ